MAVADFPHADEQFGMRQEFASGAARPGCAVAGNCCPGPNVRSGEAGLQRRARRYLTLASLQQKNSLPPH